MRCRVICFALAVVVSLVGAAEGRAAESCGMERFHFTLIPKKDLQEQLLEFQPLVDLLAEGLGMPVEVLPASSYDSVIDAMTSGAADMAVLGPASYVLAARREPGLRPFASLSAEGGPFTPGGSSYHSLLLVQGDSGVDRLEDLRGSRVGLGDPSSTSGTLVPRVSFPEMVGVSLDDFFGAEVYTGGHDRALDALIGGRVDAAFVSSSRLDEYVLRGRVAEDSLRVIWRSVPLHHDPFVFSAGVCEPVRARVKALMTTPSPALRRFLHNVNANAVTPVSSEDYRIVDKLIPSPGEEDG